MILTVEHGDLRDIVSQFPEACIDSCVTDPPYGLPGGFMNKDWDRFDGREDAGFAYYLSGLIDGEGHFGIKEHTRGTFAPFFALKLRADDAAILRKARSFLGHGDISEDADKSATNRMARWAVQTKDGVIALVEYLDKYGLRAKKKNDYDVWRDAVLEWHNRPRGNRWTGAADNTKMSALKERIENVRKYVEPAWSGHEFQDWARVCFKEVYRVLKPGAHLAVFGGTRTWHRMACAIEDSGFEIRDNLAWLYGQGFPKSLNLPGGIGTALKPSFEPIILARKPPVGTIAANVQAYGVGGLNIDGCRTPAEKQTGWGGGGGGIGKAQTGAEAGSVLGKKGPAGEARPVDGRWPPNVCVDEAVAEDLDQLFGTHKSGIAVQRNGGGQKIFNGKNTSGARPDSGYADSGGVSRYFYCPKANGKERDAGLEHWPALTGGEMTAREEGAPGATNPRSGAGRGGDRRNPHPTVKPLELMRWLCRLITPPGGIILDPFTGSGTTGCAAALEGFQFAGVELIELHAKLARDRIAYWAAQKAA